MKPDNFHATRFKIAAHFPCLAPFASLTLVCLLASFPASAHSLARNGFWKDRENPDREHARFLKIKGDGGFSCNLDGKSSFAFRIIGDSITTSMNGMDHIQFFSGLPNVVISGEEKGEPYSTEFIPLDGETYPAVCIEEEEAYLSTEILNGKGRKAGSMPRSRGGFFRFGPAKSAESAGPVDALGRMSAPTTLP